MSYRSEVLEARIKDNFEGFTISELDLAIKIAQELRINQLNSLIDEERTHEETIKPQH